MIKVRLMYSYDRTSSRLKTAYSKNVANTPLKEARKLA